MFLQELNLKERKNFLELAYYTMGVDGKRDPAEINMFNNFRAEMNLPEDEYKIAEKPLKAILTDFNSSKKRIRKAVMYEIFGIIFANNEYHKAEEEMIETLQKEWGFRDYDVKKIKRWVEDFNDLLSEAILNIGE